MEEECRRQDHPPRNSFLPSFRGDDRLYSGVRFKEYVGREIREEEEN